MLSIRRSVGNFLRFFQLKTIKNKETLFFFKSIEERDSYQLRKLNLLLQNFKENAYDPDFKNFEKLESLNDISSLPIATKTTLSKKFEAYKEANPSAFIDSTSGSSGVNFNFQFCKQRKLKSALAHQRVFDLLGLNYFSTKKITFWGGGGGKTIKLQMVEWITNNQIIYSNDSELRKNKTFLKTLLGKGTEYVSAYPSILSNLIQDNSFKNDDLIVTLSGETVQQHHLDTIKNYLTNKVFNRYGSREFGLIGHEVNMHDVDGYLVPSDRFIIETTRDGRLLITDLDNSAFPFIRYDIGDFGQVNSGESNLGIYTAINSLNGRTSDLVYTNKGESVNPQFWTLLSRKYPGIAEFQVIVDKDGVFFNSILQKGVDYKKLFIELNCYVNEKFGSDLLVQFRKVHSLELTATGKRKIVVDKTK